MLHKEHKSKYNDFAAYQLQLEYLRHAFEIKYLSRVEVMSKVRLGQPQLPVKLITSYPVVLQVRYYNLRQDRAQNCHNPV